MNIPQQAPPRPQGVERNIVITEWDWGNGKEYFHDEITTDRRNPTHERATAQSTACTKSAPISSAWSIRSKNTAAEIPVPVRDADTPVCRPAGHVRAIALLGRRENLEQQGQRPQLDDGRQRPHLDRRGHSRAGERIPPSASRAATILPQSCFPLDNSGRQANVYDPKTGKFELIDTCFGTLHLMFAEDANNTLWFAGGRDVVGWLNTKMWDETHDADKSQGWTRARARHQRQRQARRLHRARSADRSHQRQAHSRRASTASTRARSMARCGARCWDSLARSCASNPGSNPPATTLAEIYELPWNNPKAPVHGFGPRGMDIDRNGVVWTVLTSGHFASFDRRKCKGPLNGPTATGQQCPEGWTLYPFPGPSFKGTESGSADANYYNWVDQFDTFGLGKNIPIATGNASDSLLALDSQHRQVRHAARSLSDGILRQEPRRPDRRSQRRMEGPRLVFHLRHARAAAHRGRKGHHQQSGEIPAAARSAREVITAVCRRML